jgi:hypothetical protein
MAAMKIAPKPTMRRRKLAGWIEPDWAAASIAVMKSSSTVNAQGLMPSMMAAPTTVGSVIAG